VQVAPPVAAGLEVARALEGEPRFRRGGEVGGTAHEPGYVLRDRVQNLARRIAGGEPLGVGGGGRQGPVPAPGERPGRDAVELIGQVGVLLLVLCDASEPGIAELLAASADAGAEVLVHAAGDEELRVLGPAVGALGEPDLLLAERLAVRPARVLLVGRAP